jgi:hypothetical protein
MESVMGFDLGNIVGNVVKRAENNAAHQISGGVAGAINGIFRESTKNVEQFAKQKINLGRLPDQIDLTQSPNLTRYVDSSLALLTGKSGRGDGKLGQSELEQVNALREKAGVTEKLEGFDKFTKDDMGRVLSAMKEKADMSADAGKGTNNRQEIATANQLNAQLNNFGPAVDNGLKELPASSLAPAAEQRSAPRLTF